MSLFSTFRKRVNVCFDEFLIHDGELNTNPIGATDTLGPNQALSTGNPPIIPTTMPTSLTLSWPLAFASFTLQNVRKSGFGTLTTANYPYDKCHIVPSNDFGGQLHRDHDQMLPL